MSFLNFKNSDSDQRSSLQIHMRFNARGQEWRRIAKKTEDLNYFTFSFCFSNSIFDPTPRHLFFTITDTKSLANQKASYPGCLGKAAVEIATIGGGCDPMPAFTYFNMRHLNNSSCDPATIC